MKAHRTSRLSALAALLLATPAFANDEFFETKVRPLLVAHCHRCHGGANDKGGLRLDTRENFLKGGDSGPVAARLAEAVGYKNPALQMPPKGKLPDAAVADLTRWVEMGAPWPDTAEKSAAVAAKFDLAARKASHWAWRPLRPVTPPDVRDAAWPAATVDRFILARLEATGQRPAPPADPRALVRRVSYALVGLPPEPGDADAFAADPSDAALARYVDRLLASPRFGERWARHWLDVVRYAETRGHEFDNANPNAHQYRDYVVRALNADVPYNRFVAEHVAGDLLASPRPHPVEGFDESPLGTGFWLLGEQVHSPVDLKQDEADHQDNMIDVFGKAFLGLTIACARCHDHKFDAISTKDYYALAAVVHTSAYRQVRFDTRRHEADTAATLKAIDDRFGPILRREAADALRPHLADLAAKAKDKPPAARAYDIDPASVVLDFAATADWFADGPAFGTGPRALADIDPAAPKFRFVTRPAAYADPLWNRLTVAPGTEPDPGDLGKAVRAGRTLGTPEFIASAGKLYYLVRGKGLAYAAVQAHTMIDGPLHRKLVVPVNGGDDFRWVEHDITRYPGHRLHVEFTATSGNFAVAAVVQAGAPPKPRMVPVEGTEGTLAKALDRVDDESSARAVNWMLTKVEPELPSLAVYRAERDKAVAGRSWSSRLAPALWDGTGVAGRVAIRGNPHSAGVEVPRRFLEAISPEPLSGGSGRLALAGRMTDPAVTPQVPRVIVNRVWHHLFGRGIVASPDDFGVLGERPTDPELLDWLADDFIRRGWSLKTLIRQLVLSRAFRAERAEPRRLEGEAIRDALLVLGGNLDATLYGPPVPPYLTPFMEGRGRPANSGPADGGGRRSVYLAVRRNFLSPFLLAFDTPVPATAVGRRGVSNVPAQALVLLNDPFVQSQAKLWAGRICIAEADASARVDRMYRQAFARPPTADERATCLAFVAKQADERRSEAAAWADLAHALVNVKEFIFLP